MVYIIVAVLAVVVIFLVIKIIKGGKPQENPVSKKLAPYIDAEYYEKLEREQTEAAKNKKFRKFDNVIDMTGQTDLPTLICIVKNTKKVIAPDTGIIHIAKAVGVDFECVYKTTNIKVWGYEKAK